MPMKKVEHAVEALIFGSRWMLAPFYVGLVVAVGVLLVKFTQEFLNIFPLLLESGENEVVLAILSLVDISLVANLLLIVIFSGYENFVSKIDTSGHEDRPEWMGMVDFAGLKIKVIASIVAISAIQLLKAFVNVDAYTTEQLAWKVGIHATLLVSGVMFALMDRLAEGTSMQRHAREHRDGQR